MARTKPPQPPAQRSGPPEDGVLKSHAPPKPRRSSIPAPAQATIRKLMMPTAPRPPRPISKRPSVAPERKSAAPDRKSAPPERKSGIPTETNASHPSPPKRASTPGERERPSVAAAKRASKAPVSRGKKKRKKRATATESAVQPTAATASTTADEKSEKTSSPRYGVLLGVIAAAAAVTVWVLSSGKADDSAPREVAQQEPIVSPAQKDVSKGEETKSAKPSEQETEQGAAVAGDEAKKEGAKAEAEAEAAPVKHDATASGSANALEKKSDSKESGNAVEKAEAKEKNDEKKADEKEAEPTTEAVAAAPAPTLPPFDQAAAKAALASAAAQASGCRKGNDPAGNAEVMITFAPSGRVTSANVAGGPFAGTATGGCVASTLRRAKVPAFSGNHVTVRKVVRLQ